MKETKEQLEVQKNKIIELVGYERFTDFCEFIEEINFYDADLIIMMARKMACLFMLFNEFVREKYNALCLDYKGRVEIITDRAFPLYKKAIENGKYKKIVIIDDVVKRGRTILDLYKEINPYVADCKVFCYARNKERLISKKLDSVTEYFYKKDINHLDRLVDDIVNIFHCSGASYVSSVPAIDYYPEEGGNGDVFAGEQSCEKDITSDDMRKFDISASSYDLFQCVPEKIQPFCESAIIRCYHYRQLKKWKFIPYVVLKPGKAENLNAAFDFDTIFSAEYRKRRQMAEEKDMDEVKCREREYILSLCAGTAFLKKRGLLDNSSLDYRIEEYHFGEKLFSKEWKDIAFSGISTKKEYESLTEEPRLPSDSEEFFENYKAVIQDYSASGYKPKNAWSNGTYNYAGGILGQTLAFNSRQDDEKCEKTISNQEEGDGKKLLGIPLYKMIDQFKEHLSVSDFFSAIVRISDYGQGSVIHRRTEDGYVLPFLFAGEHNFKHYEISNFPALYGMYMIEKEGPESDKYRIKTTFLEKYKAFMDENDIFYLDEEMNEFINLKASKEYGLYIVNTALKYKGNKCLNFVTEYLMKELGKATI